MLETNIDDMSSEIYTYLYDKLLKNKALDVFTTSIMMKKNRPSYKLSVLCRENNVKMIEEIIFRETTTFGIRKYEVKRSELKRELQKIKTKFGYINFKIGYYNNKIIKAIPEYSDCEKLARKNNVSVREVFNQAIKTYKL